VAKPIPSYLKLHAQEGRAVSQQPLPELNELCDSFSAATGWPMRYAVGTHPANDLDLMWSAPVNPGVGTSLGHLRIDLGMVENVATLANRVPLEAAERLAQSIAMMLAQQSLLRKSLKEREADLAAGVPVRSHPDEVQHLASRMEAVIKSGAEAIGCQFGALYLLDEATTELKLRSSWGLPVERLAQPARPLATALADLEALLGHAVALESTSSYRPWNVPIESASALCVPVSSPTMPLGTLWLFCDEPRDFTTEQTNLAEVIAGRLASELDRSMLLTEQAGSVAMQRQLEAAQRIQQHSLPQTPPKITGWEIAGWSCQAGQLGGALHDWRLLDDDRLAVTVADACDPGIAAALTGSALRSAWRSECDAMASPGLLLRRLNTSLLATSSGDQWAGICSLLLETRSGRVDFGSAGRPTALVLRDDSPELLTRPTTPLGIDPEALFPYGRTTLQRGDVLVAFTRGFLETPAQDGTSLDGNALAAVLHDQRKIPANDLIRVLADWHALNAKHPNQFDRSVVILRRR